LTYTFPAFATANNPAFGFAVNPEAYSCTLLFELKKIWLFNFGEWYIDKYINNYSRVKPENIIKLKHYTLNGLSIYQTKYCKTTFLALPRLSYIIFNCPVVGKAMSLHQKSQQTHYYYRIATKLAKAYQYLLLCF